MFALLLYYITFYFKRIVKMFLSFNVLANQAYNAYVCIKELLLLCKKNGLF